MRHGAVPNPAQQAQPGELPEIDIGPLMTAPGADQSALDDIGDDISRAALHSGFFYLAGHGIDDRNIAAVIDAGERFFAADATVKAGVAIDRNNRGYLARGEAKMYGASRTDLKEVFFFGRELDADDPDLVAGMPLCAANRWPDAVPELRASILAYCDQIARAGNALLRAFAVSLGCDSKFFERYYQRPLLRGQLIHYPAPDAAAPADEFGVAEHSDFGCLTLLYQHSPGLEVRLADGAWLAVAPRAQRLVVNIGDLLERWTDGRLQSTRHRVRNQTGESRYALAIFFDPSADAVIDSRDMPSQREAQRNSRARYAPVTAGDYILERSKGVFAQFKR